MLAGVLTNTAYNFARMVTSGAQLAKRALVKLLLSLAAAYGYQLPLNRDSADDDVKRAYRRTLLRVHPDKGGKASDTQCVQACKEAWDTACKASTKVGGRPSKRDSSSRALTRDIEPSRPDQKAFRRSSYLALSSLTPLRKHWL